MNGRVYDPLIGRMTSADPIVPDALNAQAWNRYSYVGNDPLTFTDPTGHSWLSDFFNWIGSGIRTLFAQVPILRSIIQVAVTAIAGAAGCIPCAIAAAGATAAVITGLSGGKVGDMFRAGIVASATALAFYGAGELTGNFPGVLTAAGGHGPLEIGSQAHLFNVASHAGIGCLSAVASGGDCGPGALSAGAGAAATQFIGKAFPHPKTDSGDFVGGLAANSAVGGLASVAGGGKFENGAVTAAFGYLFNNVADCMRQGRKCLLLEGGGGGGASRGSLDVTRIFTPRGPAHQAQTREAIAAKEEISNGTTVYRAGEFGVQNTAEAQFWSLQNPAITPGYAGQMGMPGSGGSGFNWIMGGSVSPGTPFITRPAPGIGVNAGGSMEAVVNPGGVRLNWFHMP